jgi:Domain of unknown function (DUF4352)
MGPGIFVTFFDIGERPDRELPPIGPLDHVVIRGRRLIADRGPVLQSPDAGVLPERWLEAELELQRALGEEPGGTKRTEIRVSASDGILLRFAVFGDTAEAEPAAELGPFSVVVVGPARVAADGRILATRQPAQGAPWEVKAGVHGQQKTDVAFRIPTGGYHPKISPTPLPASAAPASTAGLVPRVDAPLLPPEPPPLVWDPRETLVPPPLVEAATPSPIEAPPIEARPVEPPREVAPPRRAEVAPPAPEVAPSVEAAKPPEPAPTEVVFRERAPLEREIYTPPPPVDRTVPRTEQALAQNDVELIKRLERDHSEDTLRARLRDRERHRSENAGLDDSQAAWTRYRPQASNEETATQESDSVDSGGLDLGAVLWRLRFLIIGALVLGAGAYGYTVVTGGLASTAGQVRIVGLGARVAGERWEYVVNGVQQFDTVGRKSAQGTYVVVRVTATNKTVDGAQLAPSQFVLIDATGQAHRAESATSGAYAGPDNPQSPFIWPSPFGAGKSATVGLIFDVGRDVAHPLLLGFDDAPSTRARLD